MTHLVLRADTLENLPKVLSMKFRLFYEGSFKSSSGEPRDVLKVLARERRLFALQVRPVRNVQAFSRKFDGPL